MEIILILILVFIVWPVFKFYLAIKKAQRQARDAFSQFGGGQQQSESRRQRKGGWSGMRSRKKVIDPNVGEYVEFEEVEVKQEFADTGKNTSSTSSYRVEQQVEDAEWEDIK